MKLPRYKSHKTVEAFKIGSITPQALGTFDGNVVPPAMFMGKPTAQKTEYVLDSVCGEFVEVVGDDYFLKFMPTVGGYFVRYSNGHESFSPADAFEDGYVENNKRRILHVTIDSEYPPSSEDIQIIVDTFHEAAQDPNGAVIASPPELNVKFIDVVDGPDFEVVRVTILPDEPVITDGNGERMVLAQAVEFRVEGVEQADANTLACIVDAFAPLLNDPTLEIDSPLVEEYNVEASLDGNTNVVLISVLLKEPS